ncbi:hypothetical protein I5Q34_33875 [Streptomyces sp. AV19]|uniref:sensor histidine kinase n=1 Tax=Streptomyces sp. AV19 TaxID=2793068 RepID=UPI0018FE07B2|nr:sensor histidine kinase [Streptomyces sp. AV19]MBH1939191.1 hypothetical protein [Streptomyces sp. AV19]MDG4536921.1 histidine kinase [Streptomyces sp. AV19]
MDVVVAATVFLASLTWAVDPTLQKRGLLHHIPAEIACTVFVSSVFLLRRPCPLLCPLAGVGLLLATGCPYPMVAGSFWVGRRIHRGLWWGVLITALNLLAFEIAYPYSGFSWQMYDGVLSPFLPALAGWGARQDAISNLLLSGRLESAERRAEEAAREMAHQERQRLAGELHDTISFRLNTIAMYAGIIESREGIDRLSREHAELIHNSAASAVRELHVLLGFLKEGGHDAVANGVNRYVNAMPKLVRETIASGAKVELNMTGVPQLLPREVDLAVYRLVQEGLTNALKYARGAEIEVTCEARVGALSVAVVNTAPAASHSRHSGSGFGLITMQDRIKKAGGSFSAGPTAGGGFALRADFSLPRAAEAQALTRSP